MKKSRWHWIPQVRSFSWRKLPIRGTPQYIARGLAAGVFAGLFPLFGLQTIVGVVLATLLKGNKLMAAAGTWISNPLTYVPILLFNFQIGRWLLNFDNLAFTTEAIADWQTFLEVGTEFIVALFTGCFVVGLFCAIASYFLCIPLIYYLRRHKTNQQLRQKMHHEQSSFRTKKLSPRETNRHNSNQKP
ncbi:DUF2062 domain-containing protein [Gloeocapsopsis dulcis]|uniref:DUF2062 domain-containing protein n=1 Tax=Gloeocapsopsis dulcis TaxID=2859516 RepID=UPI001F20370C|nr:DUF2062 domain-containing protein [Gloeocapsopsis dulcis]WNN88630.1 DUF2062 domain-containing protein [Gloeocapsopsis dulcis]